MILSFLHNFVVYFINDDNINICELMKLDNIFFFSRKNSKCVIWIYGAMWYQQKISQQ